MATQRRSLPALDRLKTQHMNRIKNFYDPLKKAACDVANEKTRQEKSAIIKDIERYALSKYPNLSLYLKCENGHSTTNSSGIDVGFKVVSTVAEPEKKSLRSLEEREKRDIAALEKWYTEFLSACAGGSDTPKFEPAHLESVSSECPPWHPDYRIE